MEFDLQRASVVAGDGIVARFPGVLCVARSTDPESLRHLLDLCAAARGADQGRALARSLARWLASAEDDLSESLVFGTLATAGSQLAVFLRGAVAVEIVADRQRHSGTDAAAWTDRLLPMPDSPVVLALHEAATTGPAMANLGLLDLHGGVVPGAGVVLRPDRSGDLARAASLGSPALAAEDERGGTGTDRSPLAPDADRPRADPAPRPTGSASNLRAVEPAADPLPWPAERRTERKLAAVPQPRSDDAIGTADQVRDDQTRDDQIRDDRAWDVRARDERAGDDRAWDDRAGDDRDWTDRPWDDRAWDEAARDNRSWVDRVWDGAPGGNGSADEDFGAQEWFAPPTGDPATGPATGRADGDPRVWTEPGPDVEGRHAVLTDAAPLPRPVNGSRAASIDDPPTPAYGEDPAAPTRAPAWAPVAVAAEPAPSTAEPTRTEQAIPAPRAAPRRPRGSETIASAAEPADGDVPGPGSALGATRSSLGQLVWDDGARYSLDGEYLVGRMPESDQRVRTGSMRSIVVEDRSGAVSRVHAEIRLDDGAAQLTDTGSRNGTYIAEAGQPGWTPLAPGQPRRLLPGTRVRMGARTFVVESAGGEPAQPRRNDSRT